MQTIQEHKSKQEFSTFNSQFSIPKVRCAIYTRKSSEEGLELEYNSLDSQRDCCMNYILSQQHEGWVLIDKHYNDGGFSGGNLNRPALKELLKDIELGLVNMVVVYKIDRLSRSLIDFTNLIDLFDKNKTSFVSVTQSFNTDNSMGRLMLNVMLSFAQFEREMTGERIRDKVRAQKKKGMWMGGNTPLGYNVIDKKLIINEEESKIIKCIFNNFIKTKSVTATLDIVNQYNYKTKTQISTKTNEILRYGRSFNKGTIYKILKNKIYSGLIENKKTNEVFEGRHEPIIEREQFQKVQETFEQNKNDDAIPHKQKRQYSIVKNNNTPYLLKGIMKCECCNSVLTPTFTRRKRNNTTSIYRYYKSNKSLKNSGTNIDNTTKCEVIGIPAEAIEKLVTNQVYKVMSDTRIIANVMRKLTIDKGQLTINNEKKLKIIKNKKEEKEMSTQLTQNSNCQLSFVNCQLLAKQDITEQEIISSLKNIETVWDELFPREQMDIIRILIKEIIISKDNVKIIFKTDGFLQILGEANEKLKINGKIKYTNTYTNTNHNNENNDKDNIEINIPVNFKKDCGKTMITIPQGKDFLIQKTEINHISVNNTHNTSQEIHNPLTKLLIIAQKWREEIMANKCISIDTIAKREHKSNSHVCRIYNLNFLAPDIKKAILTGNLPTNLSIGKLRKNGISIDWEEQRRVCGL